MTTVTWALLVDRVPAPAEAVVGVRDILVESDLDAAGLLRLRLGIEARADGWSIVDDDVFDRLTRLTLLVTVGAGVPEVVIDASVVEMAPSFSAGSEGAGLEVVALDETASMNLEEKVRAWPNMPDQVIATAIFAEHGLVPITAPTSPVRTVLETTVTQRDTDIRFLRHLARRNGFEVYVRPSPVPGVVEGHFHPPMLDAPPAAVLTVGMGAAGNLPGLRVREHPVLPTSVDAAGVDAATVRANRADASASSLRALGARPALADGVRHTVAVPDGLTGVGELADFTQAAADRSAWAVSAEGTVDTAVLGTVLRPGQPVEVRGVGRRHGGVWEVSRLRHEISADRHLQHLTLRRNATRLTGAELFLPDLALPG